MTRTANESRPRYGGLSDVIQNKPKPIPMTRLRLANCLNKLSDGDSLFVPESNRTVSTIRTYLANIRRVSGQHFVTQRRTEDGIAGLRVWKATQTA